MEINVKQVWEASGGASWAAARAASRAEEGVWSKTAKDKESSEGEPSTCNQDSSV